MKKETLLVIAVTLVAGVLLGIIYSNWKKDTGGSVSSAPPPSAPAPAVNQSQQIATLKQIVSQEPDNRNAWVRLGHSYFDSNQPMAAIEAYDKALEMGPDDPNVLTDQGVMFRRVGWYDKAIANFKKANQLQPNHQQSLFNLGIVYRYDLNDFDQAAAAWQKMLALNPDPATAQKIRAELNAMQSRPRTPQAQ